MFYNKYTINYHKHHTIPTNTTPFQSMKYDSPSNKNPSEYLPTNNSILIGKKILYNIIIPIADQGKGERLYGAVEKTFFVTALRMSP